MNLLDKNQLRNHMKDKLSKLDSSDKLKLDVQIINKLKEVIFNLSSNWSLQYGEKPILGMYVPMEAEPDIKDIISWDVVSPCFPVLKNSELRLMEYSRFEGNQWVPSLNNYFIDEKKTKYCVPDFVLVPGIVFDKRGYRLGRGKGFFDTYLEQHECYSIGLCYSFQLEEKMHVENHDKKISMLIMNNEIITFKKNNFLNR